MVAVVQLKGHDMDLSPYRGPRPGMHRMAPMVVSAAAAALTACGSKRHQQHIHLVRTGDVRTRHVRTRHVRTGDVGVARDRGADSASHGQHHHRSAGDVPD